MMDKANKKEGYFGVLYIRCEHCGREKRVFFKDPQRTFKCFHCKEDTVLSDLKRLTGKCECGNKFSYYTNIKDTLFDIECRKCGSPVTFEWNRKKDRFMSL